MPDTQAKRDWDREHTVRISLKLNANTDADILQWLRGKPAQTEIKRLIRESINKEPR